MRRLAAVAIAIWGAVAGIAHADGPVVVELYTSQGCSSCPPADEILGEISDRDDVIALALHVDYWDYIGWKDQFANPDYTKRQRRYARTFKERFVYTPQMIVGGADHINGTKPMKLAELIQKHKAAPDPVTVRLTRSGDRVQIRARTDQRLDGAVVQLVTWQPKETVAIRRGENAGRTLNYHNIVNGWTEVGTWNGRSDFSATARIAEGVPVAILVQAPNGGPILGAAQLR